MTITVLLATRTKIWATDDAFELNKLVPNEDPAGGIREPARHSGSGKKSKKSEKSKKNKEGKKSEKSKRGKEKETKSSRR